MALSQAGKSAIILAVPGCLAFILAIVAENKKPTDERAHPVVSNGLTTCHYPDDPTIALGIAAVVFLFISAVISTVALFYPYNDEAFPPKDVLGRNTVFFIFLSYVIFMVAEGLLLWAIIVETDHRKNNVHPGKIASCPTAKTGMFGGAGFLALDTTLFFLITLMLIMNARADFYGDRDSYGEANTEFIQGVSPVATRMNQNDRV